MNPHRIRLSLTGLALVVMLAIVGEFVAAASFAPPYDWVGNTISHLGATTCTTIVYPHGVVPVCSPQHLLFNSTLVMAGLAMTGISAVGRGVAGFARWAGLLWAVTGVSTMAMGLIPLDISREWHTFVTTPLFIAWPLAILAGSGQLSGRVARFGYLIGAVGLMAGLWFTVSMDAKAYGGLLERLVVWPPSLWVIAAAWCSRTRARS